MSEASLTPALPAPGPAEAPPPVKAERTLPPAQWGMIAFLLSDRASAVTGASLRADGGFSVS